MKWLIVAVVCLQGAAAEGRVSWTKENWINAADGSITLRATKDLDFPTVNMEQMISDAKWFPVTKVQKKQKDLGMKSWAVLVGTDKKKKETNTFLVFSSAARSGRTLPNPEDKSFDEGENMLVFKPKHVEHTDDALHMTFSPMHGSGAAAGALSEMERFGITDIMPIVGMAISWIFPAKTYMHARAAKDDLKAVLADSEAPEDDDPCETEGPNSKECDEKKQQDLQNKLDGKDDDKEAAALSLEKSMDKVQGDIEKLVDDWDTTAKQVEWEVYPWGVVYKQEKFTPA